MQAHFDADLSTSDAGSNGATVATITGDQGFGDEIGSYFVSPTNSDDAFDRLLKGEAEIAMASRRIRPSEARTLRDAGAGNMISTEQEHIFAVDSLVVVVHPDNPITAISINDLRRIYAGQIENWSELGGPDLPIVAINRDEGSGTWSIFADRVMGNGEANFDDELTIASSNNDAAAKVNAEPGAIGYVGYAFQRGARALDLINECGIPTTPDAFSANTEEYALQRRLYLYNRSDIDDPRVSDFIAYATSVDADGVIAKSGFIDQSIRRRAQPLNSPRGLRMIETTTDAYEAGVMRKILALMPEHDRLSTTFRFRLGSSRLDEKAVIDLERLTLFLEEQPKDTTIMLVGFTDSIGAFESNLALSVQRSEQVLADLKAHAGARIDHVRFNSAGFGEMAPAACNSTSDGQAINRRVEVWIANPEEV